MNRNEATKLILEIDEECKDIRGSSILLMESTDSKKDSDDYQVHIKMKTDWKRLRCLETIAEQYGYIVKSEPEEWRVIIFSSPMKNNEIKANPIKRTIPTGFM